MRSDRGGAPAPMSFYKGDHQGFSIGTAASPSPSLDRPSDPQAPRRRGRDAVKMVAVFVVCAALGYTVAYLPGAGRSTGLGAVGRLAQGPPAADAQVQAAPSVFPAPALAPAPSEGANPAAVAPPAERFELPPPPALPPVRQAAPEPIRHAARVAAAPRGRPAFHCDGALRPSERMVCGDAELSRLDRRLNHAFHLAVRAGAARQPLRAQQDRWEQAREQAARQGKAAVARLYRERIATLESFAR